MINRRKIQSDHINPYRWMITYTDLVTLLLTFFVLLISMSVISDQRKLNAIRSVGGAFGVEKGGQSLLGSRKGSSITAPSAPITEEDLELENLREIVLKNSLESDMGIVKEQERIIISLSNRLLFKHRSTEIEPDRLGFLSELKDVLKKSPARIELRGYADPTETYLEPDRLRPAMMLSTKRAFAILELLAEGGEIRAERIVAHGFGHAPSVSAESKDPFQQNRQVQIILDYRERLPYHVRKPAPNSFLDFKGFFFRLHGGEGGK
jgi:chemotaxis protein MotB